MTMNQAGAPVAVRRLGCALACRMFTSFFEPVLRLLLNCPNLDLLGGRGHPRAAAPRLNHRVGTPDVSAAWRGGGG